MTAIALAPVSVARTASDAERRATSWAYAVAAIAAADIVVVAVAPSARHAFLVPVTISGLLLAVDVAEWARRRLDTFDPQALVALFGMNFFYLAPILNVVLNHWPQYVNGPRGSWTSALESMAWLNVAGLLLYRAAMALRMPQRRRAHPRRTPSAQRSQSPAVDPGAFQFVATLAAVIGVVAFLFEVDRVGGPSGYINLSSQGQSQSTLVGSGWLLVISESFPLLAFAAVIVGCRVRLAVRPGAIGALFVIFAVVELFVGGLRGSRSNVLWPLLIGAGIVHLLVRPIRRRQLIAAAMIGVLFLYVYGFYKSYGNQALAVFEGRQTVSVAQQQSHAFSDVFLEDLSRADIQAILLDREKSHMAPLMYGRTYFGDLRFIIHPLGAVPDKAKAGTDMLYGRGASTPAAYSTRIYGLTGEAMLNFGPAGAVVALLPFAWFARGARKSWRRAQLDRTLARALLTPVLGISLLLLLGSDLDNTVFFLVKQVLPLAATVWVAQLAHGAHRDQQPRRLIPARVNVVGRD